MLRSKSRSSGSHIEGKQRSSVVSRTFSASKICRCDPLVDKDAHISVEPRPSAKIVNSSENGIVRVSTMQRQMGRLEEQMKLLKDQLDAAKEERDRALDELRTSKMVANEANMRLSEALSPRKNFDNDKDSSLDRLNEEMRIVKAAETRAMNLYAESKKRIYKLEEEVERRKLSESKMFESIVSQTKQLEVTKIELEESKLEIASLREKLEKLQNSTSYPIKTSNGFNDYQLFDFGKVTLESLRSELQQSKENIARAQEGEKLALLKANKLLDQMEMLKIELKDAVEAEEKSHKAMEHLALALKEVATEANQVKEKLSSTEVELEEAREEAKQLKIVLRNNEESYRKLLDEAQQENLLHQNTLDRLRHEAEESLLAWNGKEMGFVGVIKGAEEERDFIQQENARLYELLKAAEKGTKAAKDDNHKLRDILKQALTEAKIATEAATIAREENSELKDTLAKKDEAIRFLIQENTRLRIGEAAGHDKMKELKRLRTTPANSMELKVEDKEDSEVESAKFMSPDSGFEENYNEDIKSKKAFSLDDDEAALKGSMLNPEDSDGSPTTDEKNAERKRTALLRRFGDILMIKSLYRREQPASYE